MALNRIGYPTYVPYTILDARYLKLDGSNKLAVNVLHFNNYDLTMTGNASLQGTNTGDITLGTNTANALLLSGQVLGLDDKFVQWAGDTMTGNLTFSNASILEPNYIDFNTAYNTTLTEGQLGWNATENGLLLGIGGGVQINVGKEIMLPRKMKNTSVTTMTKGTVVYISGVSGNTPVITRSIATSDMTSAYTIGLCAEDIAPNTTGWVIFNGALTGLDLSMYAGGDTLYLSPTTAGAFTNVAPSAPYHYVRIGTVLKATPTGEMLVNIINGFELDELHNVAINNGTLATNDIIAYNSATQLWENKQPNTVLTVGNLTESTSSILTITGGTGAVVGSGTTIQVKKASSTQDGYLSSTDWSTFNGKQNALTFPLAASLGGTGVDNGTRTLTINTNAGTIAFTNPTTTLTVANTSSVSGTNTGDVSLATNSGLAISGQVLNMGTPSTITGATSNSVTTNTHTHAITGFEPTLTKGNLTENTSSILTITGGTGAVIGSGTTIQVKQASGSQAGYLSSADWTTFNNKQATISVSDTASVDLTFTSNTLSATVLPGGVDHNSLANLTTGDPHTQYALLAGRSGGQTLNGGTGAGDDLTLVSTAHATKGNIFFGTSTYDEVNNRLGIATTTPSFDFSFGNGAAKTIGIEATGIGTGGRSLTITAGSTTDGGTNINGSNLVLQAGKGTGSAVVGSIVFQTPDALASGTTLQSLTEKARITTLGDLVVGTNSTSALARLRIVKSMTPTATGVSNGFLAEITIDGSSVTGIDARTFNLFLTTTGSNNITSQWGSYVNASNNLDSGKTVTNHYAYAASPRIIGAGASANMGGFYAEPLIQATGTGTVTNYFGFRSVPINYAIGATTTFTNTYGVYLGALYNATYSSNSWGVYQVGTSDKNYFAGFTGFGTQTAPAAPIDVISATPSAFRRDNAAIAAIHNYYNRNTTNNNGINWTFYGDTTGVGAATNQTFGQWDLRFDQHDHATRSSTALFRNYVAGASNIWLWAGSNGNVGINTATGPTDSFTVNGETRIYNGTYNNATTNVGVYISADPLDYPRMMFADGTAARNWEIINVVGLLQFNLGVQTPAQISNGTNGGIFTLYNAGVVTTSFDGANMYLGTGADYDIYFIGSSAAGTAGKYLQLTANNTTGGAGSNNTAGGPLILNAGLGTGTGASNFIVKTGQTNATSTTLQTLTTRLTIDNAGLWTLYDGTTINTGTTTGTKIGTATTQKIGFWNAAPVARPSAYTQTYSTADKTVAARTAAALTDNTGGTVSTTLAAITAGATYSQTDMQNVKNAIASLADQINKSRNDSLDTTQAVNALIDDAQSIGTAG